MTYHISGSGRSGDPEAIKAAFRALVRALDAATEPDIQLFDGYVAGGTWVGDDQPLLDEFRLTSEEVRG